MIREYASVKPYPVRFRDCDPEGRIHWHQLMDYAQDCDDSNCALIEARSDQLHERDACWILLAQSIQLTRDRPVFEDSFFVESWSCGVKGIRFYRENRYYRNRLDEAHLFGRGISEWIICSLDDHRPLRPASVLDMDLFSQKSDPSPDPVRKLPRLTPFGGEEAGLKGHEYTVGYSDLDINNHLHNTHYLRLAIDQTARLCQVDSGRVSLAIDHFHIQFIRESAHEETLEILAREDPQKAGSIQVQGRSTKESEPSFLASLGLDPSSLRI